MAHRYGAIVSPGAGADPGLAVLLEYLQAWINTYEGDAWRALVPSPPSGTSVPVKTTHTHDPSERSLNERDLPALYAVRQRGRPQDLAADLEVSEDEIRLWWVFPPEPQAKQRSRDPFATRVERAIRVALRACAFPGWVHDRDLADIDAIRLASATLTAPASYSGADLDGVVGSQPLITPRCVTVTSTAAAGAYSLSPIIVEGEDEAGDWVSDTLTPLSANGGWTLTGTVEMVRIRTIAVPAQSLTTGSLAFGHTEEPTATTRGSLLSRHAGHEWCRVLESAPDRLDIAIQGGPTRPYEAQRITLLTLERYTRDPEDYSEPLERAVFTLNAATADDAGSVPMFEREI